jgi:hypothetical protein
LRMGHSVSAIELTPAALVCVSAAARYHRVAQRSVTVAVNYWHDMHFDHRCPPPAPSLLPPRPCICVLSAVIAGACVHASVHGCASAVADMVLVLPLCCDMCGQVCVPQPAHGAGAAAGGPGAGSNFKCNFKLNCVVHQKTRALATARRTATQQTMKALQSLWHDMHAPSTPV